MKNLALFYFILFIHYLFIYYLSIYLFIFIYIYLFIIIFFWGVGGGWGGENFHIWQNTKMGAGVLNLQPEKCDKSLNVFSWNFIPHKMKLNKTL